MAAIGGLAKADVQLNDQIVDDIEEMDVDEKSKLNKVIKDFDYALDNKQLKSFCQKNGIEFHECDLAEIKSNKLTKKQYFVFSGDKPNAVNSGSDHHWLFLHYNYLFDSAGQTDYSVGSNIKFVKTHPKQLQQYGSVVCGQYCLAFAYFLKDFDGDLDEAGIEFSESFNFDSNRKSNDEIVRLWWEEKK